MWNEVAWLSRAVLRVLGSGDVKGEAGGGQDSTTERWIEVGGAVQADGDFVSGLDEWLRKPKGRARRVLRELGVRTYTDVLGLMEQDVLGSRSAGERTWADIRYLQKRVWELTEPALRECHDRSEKMKEYAELPAAIERLRRLPVYSSVPLVGFSARQFHPTYMTGLRLSYVRFPPRALNVFRRMKLRSLGELLLTSARELVGKPGFGAGTLRDTQTIVRNIILGGPGQKDDDGYGRGGERTSKGKTSPVGILRGLGVKVGRRTERLIESLGVRCLRDFVALRQEDVTAIAQTGIRSWQAVQVLQRRLVREQQYLDEGFKDDERFRRDCATRPASAESLLRLPLYSSIALESFGPHQFHSTYKAGLLLDEIDLPERAAAAFAKSKARVLGELLLSKGSELLEKPNFGRYTLDQVHRTVREVILGGESIDYGSFESAVRSFLESVLERGRDLEIVLRRLGVGRARRRTLQAIGQRFGLCRERVRQIYDGSLRRCRLATNQSKLGELWKAVSRALTEANGSVELSELSRRFKDLFGWEAAPDVDVLRIIVGLCGDLRIKGDRVRFRVGRRRAGRRQG